MLIPQFIDDSEVLLRFVFLDNFKKKNVTADKIIDQDIFLDTRLVGISLQRILYSSFDFCKNQAKCINGKVYIGFILFKKSDSLNACIEFKNIRDKFESILEFTPLDSDNLYLVNRANVDTDSDGNPSHSDIIYINPALNIDEIKPNIPLRIFSKILYKNCKLLIDNDFNSDSSNFNSIESYFN